MKEPRRALRLIGTPGSATRLQQRERVHVNQNGGLWNFVGVAERQGAAEKFGYDGAFRRFK